MRQLAIDTSGRACSIALIGNGRVLVDRHELLGRGHAERLIPWISGLPDGGRADEIVVGCGPGSFTGVRVAIAAARGLGLGWGIPVRGVGSMALIAADRDEHAIVVAIEAGHGELFVQDFSGTPLMGQGQPVSLSPEAAAHRFQGDLVVGTGAARLIGMRGSGTAVPAEPRAAAVLHVPAAAISDFALPIYGRGADARPAIP
jgi:tRNA threonylcarbamoyladenosine biosynthesis protein TsaB